MNLLDNWDFTNPVNQRGIAVNTDRNDTGYFIDRWINYAGKFKLTSKGLQLYSNSEFYQVIEKNLLDKTLTLSVRVADEVYSLTFTAVSNTPNEAKFNALTINDVELIFITQINGTFHVVIKPKKNVLISAVKLEAGEVSTLKNDVLGVSYAEELKKCRRYYRKLTGLFLTGVRLENGDVRSNAISIEEMRTAPVISITSDGIRSGKGLIFVGFGINGTGYVNCVLRGELTICTEDNGSNYIALRKGLEIADFNGNLISSPDSMITFGTEDFDIELSADL